MLPLRKRLAATAPPPSARSSLASSPRPPLSETASGCVCLVTSVRAVSILSSKSWSGGSIIRCPGPFNVSDTVADSCRPCLAANGVKLRYDAAQASHFAAWRGQTPQPVFKNPPHSAGVFGGGSRFTGETKQAILVRFGFCGTPLRVRRASDAGGANRLRRTVGDSSRRPAAHRRRLSRDGELLRRHGSEGARPSSGTQTAP